MTNPGSTDPRDDFFRAVMSGGAVIAAVRADQWGDPTPCDDFDVRGLMDHLVVVLRRVAVMGRGGNPFAVDAHVDAGAWCDQWALAEREARDAWGRPGALEQKVQLPWTEKSGADTLRIYLSEVLVHTWDLAGATNQSPTWDDAAVEVALDAMRVELPAEGRLALLKEAVQGLRPGDPAPELPFAEAVTVEPGAAPIERLVAWTGRRP
jgi:uncharacterized protein (TIGR03086 family)